MKMFENFVVKLAAIKNNKESDNGGDEQISLFRENPDREPDEQAAVANWEKAVQAITIEFNGVLISEDLYGSFKNSKGKILEFHLEKAQGLTPDGKFSDAAREAGDKNWLRRPILFEKGSDKRPSSELIKKLREEYGLDFRAQGELE